MGPKIIHWKVFKLLIRTYRYGFIGLDLPESKHEKNYYFLSLFPEILTFKLRLARAFEMSHFRKSVGFGLLKQKTKYCL